MRKLYTTKVLGECQQGSIINNCILAGYEGRNVFGIIVTPRCDIENKKITTVHYLPIVRFIDWFEVDFWNHFINSRQKQIENQILTSLESFGLSPEIYNYVGITELIAKLRIQRKKEKEIKKLEELYVQMQLLQNPIVKNDIKVRLLEENKKLVCLMLRDVKENRVKEYYLIESWEDGSEEFYIIFLREVKRITFSLSMLIATGIFENDIPKNEWDHNDIEKTGDEEGFIYTLARINSPFIEHLIQSFINNFGKIGIEDIEQGIEEKLFSNCLKIYKK